jgi:hypothetical protein
MQRVGKTDECKKAKMSRNVPLTRPFTKVSGRKEWLAADGLWRETSVRGNGTAKEAKVDEAQMDCRWAWASQPQRRALPGDPQFGILACKDRLSIPCLNRGNADDEQIVQQGHFYRLR